MTDTTIQPPLVEPFGLVGVPPQVVLQLQTILSRMAAQDDRISDLEATNSTLLNRLASLEATSAPPVEIVSGEVELPQQVTQPPDTAILEDILQLRGDVEGMNDLRASEIAQDRQRIAILEVPEPPAPTTKTTGHIRDIRTLLMKADYRLATVKALASRLGVTKRRTWQIVHRMEGEGLVNLLWDPRHKGRKLVELRKQISTRSGM